MGSRRGSSLYPTRVRNHRVAVLFLLRGAGRLTIFFLLEHRLYSLKMMIPKNKQKKKGDSQVRLRDVPFLTVLLVNVFSAFTQNVQFNRSK